MRSQNWKYRAAKLMILGLLTTVNFFMITNIITLPQTPSVESQCTDVEIQRHIQQLNKGETADFDALVACKSKAVPALIKALDENKDENFRIITIAVLGDIDAEAAPAVPVLNGLLKDKKENIRIVVVYALGQIMGKDSVQPLIQALKDKNEDVRSSAANAVGKIGKDAVPALIIALKDADSNIRAGVADALGQIGTDAESAVPYLTIALKDSDSKVRSAATNALEKIKKRYSRRGCPASIFNPSRSCAYSQTIAEQATINLRNNSPVMCRIPAIKAVLRWKCP